MHVVVVQCPFLKPDWFCESSCSASRKLTICFIISRSYTLDRIGKIFGIGLIRNTFHWPGNIFWFIDELMTWHIRLVMSSIHIFKYFAGMLLQPVEQSARIDWMAFLELVCVRRKVFNDGLEVIFWLWDRAKQSICCWVEVLIQRIDVSIDFCWIWVENSVNYTPNLFWSFRGKG